MDDLADHNSLSDRELCGLVAEMNQRIDSHVRKVAESLDLTYAQAIALRELTGPLTLREMAKRICSEAPNATFVADRLEEAGYVTRVPHPNDRRAKQLLLTDFGQNKRQELLSCLIENSPLSPLSISEQLALKALLERATGTEPTQ